MKVATAVYPKYETRGDLKECVGRFRDWYVLSHGLTIHPIYRCLLIIAVVYRLQNTVIDLEVENRTASPTVDPSVHVILVGHSMGGIVAAETLLLLAAEQPIPPKPTLDPSSSQTTTGSLDDSTLASSSRIVEPGSFMFPHIQGILAFDTPFLGIAPGVVSYGAEGHYKTATTAYNTVSEVAGLFGFGNNNSSNANQKKGSERPLPSSSQTAPATDAAATPSWQRWGRYAMFAGAAGAVAAGGAAAMYSQRDRLTDGWGWVSSHLVFIGSLARPADLRQRVALMSKVQQERKIGCTNFYTSLGQNATSLVETTNEGKTSFSQKIIRSKYRTFCTLPNDGEDLDAMSSTDSGLRWIKAVNDKAKDEVKAHVSMFSPQQNPGFRELVEVACKVLVNSIDKRWYDSATGPVEEIDEEPSQKENSRSSREVNSPFMGGDDVVVID